MSGRQDGISREWYKNGVLRSERVVRAGKPQGEFREWHSSGTLKSRQVFDDTGLLREEELWNEAGHRTRS
ncbi:hypothetical protein [Streptomyces sp. NPDC048551]|uniref:toxin-antitoxin system YwqK family antitoxin n=1 Tax=Streptomyces sp. NPDC048551 TaxID=3155758 RepID=UPI003443A085